MMMMMCVQEMIKRCHQCMNMIVSAKEHQAAEANKNAAILLEELSLEREREETKKAAAARKRDRKKLKKKERADRDKDAVDDTVAGLLLVHYFIANFYHINVGHFYSRYLLVNIGRSSSVLASFLFQFIFL